MTGSHWGDVEGAARGLQPLEPSVKIRRETSSPGKVEKSGLLRRFMLPLRECERGGRRYKILVKEGDFRAAGHTVWINQSCRSFLDAEREREGETNSYTSKAAARPRRMKHEDLFPKRRCSYNTGGRIGAKIGTIGHAKHRGGD